MTTMIQSQFKFDTSSLVVLQEYEQVVLGHKYSQHKGAGVRAALSHLTEITENFIVKFGLVEHVIQSRMGQGLVLCPIPLNHSHTLR